MESWDVIENKNGETSHSYRGYPIDYFEKLLDQYPRNRVKATMEYLESGRFKEMLQRLHEFQSDTTREAFEEFKKSNSRMVRWLELYQEIYDKETKYGESQDIKSVLPKDVERELERGNISEARNIIRNIGSGIVFGTFHEFLDIAHQTVVDLDKDEQISFFKSNPRMESWIDVYAKSEGRKIIDTEDKQTNF